MSFKIHLIIVCVIIIAVYSTWQISKRLESSQQPVNQQENVSPYKISIISASYGLNCLDEYNIPNQSPSDPFAYKAKKNEKLKKDNVLELIARACDNKIKCSIILKPELLGGDPAPDCVGEILEIEYRCFSFDRPWTIKGEGKSLDIDCSNAEARAAQ